MDLLSLVFTVRPLPMTEPRPLPTWWGAAVQSLLFEALREAAPEETAAIHDDASAPRPVTASTLVGPRLKGGALNPEADYTFRMTALNAPVAERLLQATRPGERLAPGSSIELDYLPFTIVRVTDSPDEDEWAGTADYQALAATHLLTPNPPDRQVMFELISPTAFRSSDRTQPLPLPRLVFHSLAARWNAFAPVAFPPEVERYAEECLAISRFDLHSRPVTVNNGLRIGAVGRVAYTALTYDRYWLGVLHTLAAYARFAGIGIMTGPGMGQARAITG